MALDTALLAAPPGFAAGCRELSSLATAAPSRAIAIATHAARSHGVSASGAAPEGAAEAAAGLVCRVAQGVDLPTVGKALAAFTDLSEAGVKVLLDALAAAGSEGAAASPAGRSALAGGGAGGVPRLAGVDWAVSVATHSTGSAALGTVLTHVTLRTDGAAAAAVVLTLPQLVALETAVREAAAALETA